jgi:hypothetical protein
VTVEGNTAGWTFDTLHAHLVALINAEADILERHMSAAETAITRASAATEKRFEGVNEFRAQLADQARTFLPRTEYQTAHEALGDRINTNAERLAAIELRITSRLDADQGAETGAEAARRRANALITAVIGGLAVLIALVSTVAYLLKK